MRIPAVLPVLLVLAAPAVAHASDVYVNPALGCSDSASATVAASPSTPWCSLAPAIRLARPGDVVHVAPRPTRAVPPRRLGHDRTRRSSIKADGAVTIAAPAGTVSVMLVGVHDVVLRGMTVLAAAPQAVWVDNASRVTLDGVTVTNSAGTGVQIKARHLGDDHATRGSSAMRARA